MKIVFEKGFNECFNNAIKITKRLQNRYAYSEILRLEITPQGARLVYVNAYVLYISKWYKTNVPLNAVLPIHLNTYVKDTEGISIELGGGIETLFILNGLPHTFEASSVRLSTYPEYVRVLPEPMGEDYEVVEFQQQDLITCIKPFKKLLNTLNPVCIISHSESLGGTVRPFAPSLIDEAKDRDTVNHLTMGVIQNTIAPIPVNPIYMVSALELLGKGTVRLMNNIKNTTATSPIQLTNSIGDMCLVTKVLTKPNE
jgi:hypothetical protein